jgi:hypothetical protein
VEGDRVAEVVRSVGGDGERQQAAVEKRQEGRVGAPDLDGDAVQVVAAASAGRFGHAGNE